MPIGPSRNLETTGLRCRLPICVVVLVIWTAIIAASTRVIAGLDTSVVQFVSQGIAWPIVLAAGFLVLVQAVFLWRDIGFRSFRIVHALRLMWLPLLYLCVFAAMISVVGLPPARSVAYIVVNTCLVGFSEELMFRGILFGGLRSRLSLWASIWICCALFGLVHVLNAVQTGHLAVALLQAVAAFMTGFMLMALRLRTGSLYPAMLLHAAWDCLPLLAATRTGLVAPDQPLPSLMYLAPLLVLPNFLYALYLLRSRRMAEVAD